MNLDNAVVLVTGGGSGLGAATAEALLAKGTRVMVMDLREVPARERLLSCAVDVTDEASVQQAIRRVMAEWGRIDGCVNCAGIGVASKTVGKQGAHALDLFRRVIDINLIGSFNVLRLAAEQMQHNTPNADGERGLIINTASVAAFDGQVGQAAYSASKAGIVGMTLPIARDLASVGIRVNTIAPGIFNTPMMQALPDQVKAPLIEMTQFPKRLGHPSEYAQLVVHLFENAFLNGETIRLDGAIRMQPR